jgi:hypothetical protein
VAVTVSGVIVLASVTPGDCSVASGIAVSVGVQATKTPESTMMINAVQLNFFVDFIFSPNISKCRGWYFHNNNFLG